ncbi:hypothetical protein BY458DRAFT_565619 [Sporodiniella umbellata]|nr:hypothetical protein BY458DRAFT_565619 [Sporodiniella umbellata]
MSQAVPKQKDSRNPYDLASLAFGSMNKYFRKRVYSTTASNIEKYLKNRTDLSSSTYRGTMFELQTLQALETTAKMELSRVGGKGDGGVDLRGTWVDLPIIVQCKNVKEGCSPEHIRGLMGTASLFKKKHISILATQPCMYTSDVLSHFRASNMALGLACVNDITLVSLLFNKKAEALMKNKVTISTLFDALGNETLQVDILE